MQREADTFIREPTLQYANNSVNFFVDFEKLNGTEKLTMFPHESDTYFRFSCNQCSTTKIHTVVHKEKPWYVSGKVPCNCGYVRIKYREFKK